MVKKCADRRDENERREDALRPNPRLGYDRDVLGLHLMSREAFRIAESQFRRAVWLNPFEPQFKNHLAWCLYKRHRFAEAQEWARSALCQKDDPNTRALLDLIARNTGTRDASH
jgi:Flp pilus assembly protein TadD